MSEVVDGILALIKSGVATKDGIARATGQRSGSLDQLGAPDWVPSAQVLRLLEEYLDNSESELALASPEQIINEARNGRMFILVDDADLENHGDLVIPAQMATPDAINFMATHGRGLICLALSQQRTTQLGLDLMSSDNRARHENAFTVSIEARIGVTTGISAADRARTISVAIDGTKGPADIVSPGHVFPLVSREGGVLVRAGHTEAAVDVARLAGLNPSGVICKIMREDGAMARLDDLMMFARKHGLKIGTIRDLISFRLQHDHLVEKRAEHLFDSKWGGEWRAMAFFNRATQSDQIVLQKGVIDPSRPTLVRMHQMMPLADMFGGYAPKCDVLSRSMEIIAEEGCGIIVAINRRSLDYFVRLLSQHPPVPGQDNSDELRDYGVGAQILAELGVNDMILLSNSPQSLVALQGYGLKVVGRRALDS